MGEVVDDDQIHDQHVCMESMEANMACAFRSITGQKHHPHSDEPGRFGHGRNSHSSSKVLQEEAKDCDGLLRKSNFIGSVFHQADSETEHAVPPADHLDSATACMLKARNQLQRQAPFLCQGFSAPQPEMQNSALGCSSPPVKREQGKRPSSARMTRELQSGGKGFQKSSRHQSPPKALARPSSSRPGWSSARVQKVKPCYSCSASAPLECARAPWAYSDQHLPYSLVCGNRREERNRRVAMEKKRLQGMKVQPKECW